MKERTIHFTGTAAKGEVSALLVSPPKPSALLVMGHGAGAGITSKHLSTIASSLSDVGIATFRFNFPYMESGRKSTDTKPVCIETFGNAVARARKEVGSVPVLVGGHSFGGRMSSHFVAEVKPPVNGLIYFSFPLHAPGKEGIERAAHMSAISQPQLFLSGTRDTFARLDLLKQAIKKLPNAVLHELDTADHGLKVLKRTRTSTEDVYEEVARVASAWLKGSVLK